MKRGDLPEVLALPGLDATVMRVERLMEDMVRTADPELADPCVRILRAKGKRLRPTLVIAAAACGNSPARESVLAAAASVEFMHNGSLVHDDLMDDAHSRRGVATINAREGPGMALLCGNVLFALSGQAAARVGEAAAVEAAGTIVALCNGQTRELLDNFNTERTPEATFRSIEGKTAALFRTACRLGGICGGLSGAHVDALGCFGEDFGYAFQLVDDVLDLVSSEARVRKPVHHDLRRGVYTLPVTLGLTGEAMAQLAAAVRDGDMDEAMAIVWSGNGLKRVAGLAIDHTDSAAGHLAPLIDRPAARGLVQLAASYVEGELQKAGLLEGVR